MVMLIVETELMRQDVQDVLNSSLHAEMVNAFQSQQLAMEDETAVMGLMKITADVVKESLHAGVDSAFQNLMLAMEGVNVLMDQMNTTAL